MIQLRELHEINSLVVRELYCELFEMNYSQVRELYCELFEMNYSQFEGLLNELGNYVFNNQSTTFTFAFFGPQIKRYECPEWFCSSAPSKCTTNHNKRKVHLNSLTY